VTGDQADILKRLKTYVPPWFGAGDTPVLDGVLTAAAFLLAQAYAFYAYARLQTRILTATGFWLDLIAEDFFGDDIKRKAGQSDASFRAYIIANLLRPRATRPAMASILLAISGQPAIIFEPNRPADTGAWRSPTSPGYWRVMRWGSLAVPFTCLITAFRPLARGGLAGSLFFNAPQASAFATPLSRGYYNSLSLDRVTVDDDDIYRAIDRTKVAGTICWTGLSSGVYAPPNPYPPQVLDADGDTDGQLDFSDPDNSDLLPGI